MIKNTPLVSSYDISEAELPFCQRLSPQQTALMETEAADLVTELVSALFSGNIQEDTQVIRNYIHNQSRFKYITEKLRESNSAWQLEI